MADLAVSAVTINRAWNEGGPAGRDLSCRQVTLVLTGQGGATNKITAAVLGLTVIEQSTPFVANDNEFVFPSCPSYDGTFLTLLNVTTATDAQRATPVDVSTETIRGVVKGY